MERLMTVKGRGEISEPPDWIIINLELGARNSSYEKTMEKDGEKLNQLRNSLVEEGFEKKDIKTTRFDVDTEYEWVKDSRGEGKNIFKGYRCNQDLYIGFPAETKKLSRVLQALTDCPARPEFSIRYSIKNQEKAKEKLLSKAVKDAFAKAKVLAEAGRVKLGEIVRIDYDWSVVRFERSYYSLKEISSSCSIHEANLDFQPDDIEASDNVSVVWEIE